MSKEGLAQAVERMSERGVDPLARRVFEEAYAQLEAGSTGLIPEADIEPLHDVPLLDDLVADDDELAEALAHTAVVKLNGGLGTSMGLSGPKSVLEVREGLTFLDVVARQVLALRERHGVPVPLVLMNSFRTREQSLEVLAGYDDLAVDGLPLDFLQNAEPKLRADDLTPVSWPDDPDLEWCPPGHGDVYVALVASGVLAALRDKGFRYAFLSNSDNLGATCDPAIPAWMARESIPYVSEVCERTVNDRKGGHLAVRRSDGRVVLRDSAMVAPEDQQYFQDTERHPLFHANNLWVDLDALAEQMAARDGVLGLPIIVNRKTVDPSRKDSTPGHPARVGDGHGDRGLRRVPRPARAAQPVPSRQDHQRAAAAALGPLRLRRRFRDRRPDATTGPAHRPRRPLHADRRLRRTLPRGRARAGRVHVPQGSRRRDLRRGRPLRG